MSKVYNNDLEEEVEDEEEFEEVDYKKQVNEYREMKSKKDVERVENEHYDEAVNLNESDDNLAESKDKALLSAEKLKKTEDDLGGGAPMKASSVLPLPKFDYSEFEKLTSNPEYKNLLQHMDRFQPAEIQLETKLKPFIPSYIPAIGEVDAFLKVPRPDKAQEDFGLSVIDEPTIEGEDPNIFIMILRSLDKKKVDVNYQIPTVKNAEKNPKEIQNWVDKIGELHKNKMSSSVSYSKQMPDMESLMQIWHEKMEQGLNEVKLPDENINLSTEHYSKIVCNLLDIPIHKTNNNKSLIESLHVLFSLYSVVKESQGYKNISKAENVQSIKFN